MRDTLEGRRLAEIRAVLVADLGTSGAKTAESLKAAATTSLETLLPEPQTINVEPSLHVARWFNIRIEGPTLIAGIPIRV